MSGQGRPAVFLDRDGTIMVEKNYLADPDGVELIPGAVTALRRFRDAGYALVLITNQSGIGRGYFTEEDFRAVQRRLDRLLADHGVAFDATYYCPHHPEETCACRKPGTALFAQAIRELGLDPHGSLFIGDRLNDVLPASVLGGRGVLVRTGYGAAEETGAADTVVVADDLDAASRALAGTRSEWPKG